MVSGSGESSRKSETCDEGLDHSEKATDMGQDDCIREMAALGQAEISDDNQDRASGETFGETSVWFKAKVAAMEYARHSSSSSPTSICGHRAGSHDLNVSSDAA